MREARAEGNEYDVLGGCVADVLGHAAPGLTLNESARAVREAKHDSFLDFGAAERHQTAQVESESREGGSSNDEIPNALASVAWRAGRGSNPRPPGSKPGALSN